MLTAAELLDMQALLAATLVDAMDVYAVDAGTGNYTTLVASGVACRLSYQPGATEGLRPEAVPARLLLFDPAHAADVTERRQVRIAGQRWNVVGGSVGVRREPGGGVLVGTCAVESAGAVS